MAEKEYIEAKDLDDFRNEIMDKFLSLCNYNDYNKLTLLRIGETIDEVYDKYVSKSSADVVEVVHGEWVQNPYCKRIFYCSECGRTVEDGSYNPNPSEHFPYCHCGANMDGGKHGKIS